MLMQIRTERSLWVRCRRLVDNVGRQAGMMNRKQEPQVVGDANRVLVGR